MESSLPIFLSTTLSFLSLLLIAGVSFTIASRYKLPYTVLLVAVGILIGEIAPHIPWLAFLDDFSLTPEILLYVFLPILLFESAYNIRFRDMMNNLGSISLLSVVSLFVSALIIGTGLYFLFGFFGMPIPFLVALLFGSLISATDPVSVLALFKELGAPKRLTLIFEWESLFNDGTALALFLVILSFFVLDHSHANLFIHWMQWLWHSLDIDLRVITGVLSFISMVWVGILFGALIGVVFSRCIHYFGKNKVLELTLTMTLAHMTFLLADVLNHFVLPVSGVIATTIAAIVVGNYGKYKMSHETRHTMGEHWEFFAFVSNSIVFLLVGVLIVSLPISWTSMILPILIAIWVTIFARAISVYGVIMPWNISKKEDPIPMNWMHLLSWWSLRWSLAIVMALLIPTSLMMPWQDGQISVQSFILAITVGSILFTTFIKATTITPMIRKMKIDHPSEIDELSYIESKILFLLWVVARIRKIGEKGYFHPTQRQELENRYKKAIYEANKELERYIHDHPKNADDLLERVVSLYALHSERAMLIELFSHSEIDEVLFRYQLEKIEGQIDRIESGKTQLKDEIEKATTYPWSLRMMEKWIAHFESSRYKKYEQQYLKYRTRVILLEKVIKELHGFEDIEIIYSHPSLSKIKELYMNLLKNSQKNQEEIRKEHPHITNLEAKIIHHTILEQQSNEISELIKHEIVSKKSGEKLLKEFA